MFKFLFGSGSSTIVLTGLASLVSKVALAADQSAFSWEFFQESDAGFSGLSSEQASLSQDVSPGSGFDQIKTTYRHNTESLLRQSGSCNADNVAIRREWYVMLELQAPEHMLSFL